MNEETLSGENKANAQHKEQKSDSQLVPTPPGVIGEGTSRTSLQNEQPPLHLSGLASMPVTVQVKIPLTTFRLQALSALAPGCIVSTAWPHSEDLPVLAGNVRLAWAEFAINDHGRSVRVTRIS